MKPGTSPHGDLADSTRLHEKLTLPPSAHSCSCSGYWDGDFGRGRRKPSHFRAIKYYLHTEQSLSGLRWILL